MREIVQRSEPLTPYTAGELMSVLAQLAMFADAQGYPPGAESWLSRELIERFILVGTNASKCSRGNYRTKLHRLREAVLGPDCQTGKPVKLSAATAAKPYTDSEVARLWYWADGQPTDELRAGCRLLLCLGRGCGLDSPEIIPLRAHDIRRPGNGAAVVHIRGRRERQVVCRRAWERPLLHEAARFDGQVSYLFRPRSGARGKNTVTNFLARCHHAPSTPTLVMGRLRATWLVELIEQCVPLPVIVAAAGLDTLHGLSRILPHVRGMAAGPAADLLRGDL
ncbi:hypothetical protein [Actinomadura rupiterrae]|uniref:hypothetical protein n=1 Tax=Actinomadura rupiterrae TaxID=559627 RepID=UPI0020A56429|nr:hypothetical protein [Actinomadura rupiterrae]MCP2340659.1 hypothetical protein [Actinomadura rupiterrae]